MGGSSPEPLGSTKGQTKGKFMVLLRHAQQSEADRYVCVPLVGCLEVKDPRRCLLHYLWSLHIYMPYFYGRSSVNSAFGVAENLKIKLLQTTTPAKGREQVLLSLHLGGKKKFSCHLNLWVINLLNPTSAFSNASQKKHSPNFCMQLE